MKDEKAARGISFEIFPIIHPHEVLSYLWDHVGLRVSPEEVAKYWQHARQFNQQWATLASASDRHIPIGLHGDAARLWTQVRFEKVIAIHLNVCHFRPRSIRHSRFLLFSCPYEKLYKNRTLNQVFRRITWSLEAAFDGMNPQTGVGGKALSLHDQKRSQQPLTRCGARFALCELRGDWEWHVFLWRPRASWQSNVICFRCPCLAKGPDTSKLYYNSGDDCSWESEEFTLQEFVVHRLKETNLCAFSRFW